MVAVFNKELLSWYLITLKLRETVESGIPRSSTGATKSLELPEEYELQLQKQHHVPSDSLQVAINEDGENCEEAATSPEYEWIISIKEKLEQARQDDAAGSWEKLSIYRVPHYLREGDIKAYVPQIVSLGPYHHGKRRLRQMDQHKWRSLHRVLKRTNQEIQVYLDSMKEHEERALDCYEGTITLGSNEFVEMLVLDGCFVLELFQGAAVGFQRLGYARNDPVFAMRGSKYAIHRDMIMLENQLPLFVLDRLLGIQLGKPDQKGKFAKLAIRFFDPLMPTDEPLTKNDINRLGSSLGHTNTFDPFSDLGGLHCLDVFRRSLLRSGPKPLPRMWLKKSNDITSYVIFMDNLINSHGDVGYFHYFGIIEHWLGSNAEITDLFNRLCQEVVFDTNNSYLSQLSEDVNRYYNHRWNAWRAALKHRYFNNPWAIISFFAACILLVLTFAQTFYGVYGYYRPST
ncbi:hypothetical protein CRYUN_Cryun24cG0060300 [Craigia yunnanensis]